MSSAVYYTSRPLTTFRDIVDDAPETRFALTSLQELHRAACRKWLTRQASRTRSNPSTRTPSSAGRVLGHASDRRGPDPL
jgi:hypothetical protein